MTAKPPVREIKPVAIFVAHGKVITWEFLSPDGSVLAGYRSVAEAAGFLAWERYGDLIMGFSGKTHAWFPTEDAARAWVLERMSRKHESPPVSAAVSGGAKQQTEAA